MSDLPITPMSSTYFSFLPCFYGFILLASEFFQSVEPHTFESHPIIFGDFIKMGVDKADRMYEELSNATKLKQVLTDVS